MKHSRYIFLIIYLLLNVLSTATVLAKEVHESDADDPTITVLLMVPDQYGANFNLYKDHFEQFGWNVITTALTKQVNPCPWAHGLGLPVLTVDTLISELENFEGIDAIAITSASRFGTSTMDDLMNNQFVLDILKSANDEGIVISAYCTAVRLLAAADIINGVNITGQAQYMQEYLDAGANYISETDQPVIDGNIVTSIRGDYNSNVNCMAFENAIEMNRNNVVISGDSETIQESDLGLSDVTWSRTIGGSSSDECYDVIPDGDGGCYTLGYTYSVGEGSTDILLCRVDAEGSLLWSKTFGGEKRDFGSTLLKTEDHLYLIGYTTSMGNGKKDVFVVKTDTDGNSIWEKTYGGSEDDYANDAVIAENGNLLIVGSTLSIGNGEEDMLALKMDSDGNEIFMTSIGAVKSDLGYGVCNAYDAGYIIIGATGSFSLKRDIHVAKLSVSGATEWEKTYGANDDNDWGYRVLPDNNGNYIIGGKADIHGTDFYNMCIMKIDAEGNEIWKHKYGNTKMYEFGNDIIQFTDSTFYVAGIQKSYETGNEFAVMKIDADGTMLNWDVYSLPCVDWLSSITKIGDNTLLMGGYTNSAGHGMFDQVLIKTSILNAEFEADTVNGRVPIEVNYLDKSTGSIHQYEWDFQNDGVIDSYEKNPSFVYDEPGIYSVRMNISDGVTSRSIVKENLINVYSDDCSVTLSSENSTLYCEASESLSLTEGFLLEAWIRPTNIDGSQVLFTKSKVSMTLVKNNTYHNALQMRLFADSSSALSIFSPDSLLKENEWQHIAFTYNNNGTIHLVVNGEEKALHFPSSQPLGNVADNSDKDLSIASNANGSSAFQGYIDEIRVFNKYVTPEEIKAKYVSEMTGDEDGLVAYWACDEGEGNCIADRTSLNNELIGNEIGWGIGKKLEPVVSIDEIDETKTPDSFTLLGNFPNPFNPSTYITYYLPYTSEVSIQVYTISGEAIINKILGFQEQGFHSEKMQLHNFASGIYLYSVKCKNEKNMSMSKTNRMVLLK